MTLFVILGTVIGKHRPATPAEVAEAHERCKTCKQYGWITNDGDPTLIDHVCDWDVLTIEDPALDYCRHHSTLTKEHDDDKPE